MLTHKKCGNNYLRRKPGKLCGSLPSVKPVMRVFSTASLILSALGGRRKHFDGLKLALMVVNHSVKFGQIKNRTAEFQPMKCGFFMLNNNEVRRAAVL